MKKITTFLFFFFLIAIGVILMLLFTKKVDFTKFMEKSTVEEEKDKKKKKEKKNKDLQLSKEGKSGQAVGKKEIEKKEEKTIDEKEEKKEEKKKEEKKKEEDKKVKKTEEVENVLEKTSRKGKYWVMFDYTVTEKEDFFEVKGSVYDATLYAEWADEVGSDGIEEGKTIKAKDGFRGKNLSFQIPKKLKVGVSEIEWMEIKEKPVKEFLNGNFGSFLFENEGNKITEMLDWYMNYAG